MKPLNMVTDSVINQFMWLNWPFPKSQIDNYSNVGMYLILLCFIYAVNVFNIQRRNTVKLIVIHFIKKVACTLVIQWWLSQTTLQICSMPLCFVCKAPGVWSTKSATIISGIAGPLKRILKWVATSSPSTSMKMWVECKTKGWQLARMFHRRVQV